MTHTDITIPFWLRPLSPKALAFAQLARLDRPIGTWLLLLPGWWAIAMVDCTRIDLFALFGIGAIVMRGAGCVINDLWDRDLDGQVERTSNRPLVSGAVSTYEAFAFLGVLLLIGFVILLYMNATTIALGVLSLAFVATYPLMKRFTWWPQMFLGFTFNFGVLMGWTAAAGLLEWPALILYAAGIFWTLGYDTIYAHQDRVDDTLIGVKSTARLFGNHSKVWVGGFYVVTLALMTLSFWSVYAPTLAYAALSLPAMHMIWQIVTWTIDNPARSLRIFQSNRDFGLIVLCVILIFS